MLMLMLPHRHSLLQVSTEECYVIIIIIGFCLYVSKIMKKKLLHGFTPNLLDLDGGLHSLSAVVSNRFIKFYKIHSIVI